MAVAITTAIGLVLAAGAPAAPPALTLTAGDAGIGGTVQATAHLSGGVSATGEITFQVFDPDDATCAGPALSPAPSPAPVSGDGDYQSGEFTPPSAGAYRWSAHYSGDAENEPADSTCEATSAVAKAAPSLGGEASDATVGGTIHDRATATGGFSPSGEVSFSVYAPGDDTCSTPLATTNGAISGATATSPDFTTAQAGSYRWTASYPGDDNNEAVELGCNAAGQTSAVAKAAPSLGGEATSAGDGEPITDEVTLAGGFEAEGELVFRAYGPANPTCSGTPAHEKIVTVAGNRPYEPPAFEDPPAGLYRWTVTYAGDENNAAAALTCGTANQTSAAGTLTVTLTTSASSGTIGGAIAATAAIGEGASPAGLITFKAFGPDDASCAGGAAFAATTTVAGDGSYASAPFVPSQVGIYRWTVSYSGDLKHAPVTTGCGAAISSLAQAQPTIAGHVKQRPKVGTPFRDVATLSGGHAPSGTVTFRIFGPGSSGCGRADYVDTVEISGNGTVRSDPFVAQRPGRYVFVASYSGDAANRTATEACPTGAQTARVIKQQPRLKPRAQPIRGRRVAIRAKLAGAAAPSGVVSFRLYRPGDKRCQRGAAFSGRRVARSNGNMLLAKYRASRRGVYRLVVAYSGDPRNKKIAATCGRAQRIRIR
ncbi:MAG: hypothetical protein R2725_14605 [Solirubrobacterales bacterium]